MKLKRSAAAAIDTGVDAGVRRRGLGPFSGGQLTLIIVTFAVLLLFPIGAWAVAGSNVFVTDSVSGKQASVNTSGQLATSENAASVLIAAGTATVNPNSSTLLFINTNVSAYNDVRIYVNAAGPLANHEVVQVLTKAGAVVAPLDQWTMAANIETRRYENPGLALSAAEYNFDAVNSATVTWSLVGRPN
jgi:hypothetical protein